MKRILLTAFAVASLFVAEAQVAMPQPSPTQSIRQDFGMGKIELIYSRPSVKGRSLFGEKTDLAPVGEIWRTGANAATKIRFTDPVVVGGKTVDTGTYVLYTIPQKGDWDVILNKGVNNWGTDGYKQSDDVVRLKAPARKVNDKTETLTMQFANVQNESVDLQLLWGNTLVTIPIKTNIKDRLRNDIEAALKGEKKPYYQAANFFYEWDKDYTKALENINKAIEASPKSFWMYMLKARIQKDMGDKAGAKASANKVIEIATEAKNDDYVRMANDFLKKV